MTPIRTLTLTSCLFALAVALTALPSHAAADILFGANVDAAIPTDEMTDVTGIGVGVGVRAGYVLPIPLIDLSLELDGQYSHFLEDEGPALDVAQLLGAVHLAIDLIVVAPEVFAGVGYGWVGGENDGIVIEDMGVSWLVGAGLDLSALPFLSVGVHVAYNELVDEDGNIDAYRWVDAGLHAKVVF